MPMKRHAVLYALGSDRVGIADDLADALTRRKLEIERSRMTALSGKFAIMVRVSGDKSRVSALDRDLFTLGSDLGCYLQLHEIEAPRTSEKGRRLVIEGFSSGPAGISNVTGVLKKYGINIEDLRTDSSTGCWSSEITFHMRGLIRIPPSCPVDSLRRELRELEHEHDLDIVVKPVPTSEESYAGSTADA
jgi:glycine cleavage system transcriptional repressor